MKITPRQIANFLTTPYPEICAILLHGNDVGLRAERFHQLAALYCDNLNDVFSVTTIAGSSLSTEPGKIVDSAAHIPASGRRLVLVKATGTEALEAAKEFLINPVMDAMVIIDAKDTNTKHTIVKLFESTSHAAAIGCYPNTMDDIRLLAQTIFKKDNISVDHDALNLICQRLGSDHGATKAELNKLALLAAPGGEINVELVLAALGDSAILTINEIAQSIANGQVSELAAALQKAWIEETNCVMIVRGCQMYFNQLRMLGQAVQSGQTAQNAVRSLRPPIHFKLQNAFMLQLKRWQPDQATNILDRLQDIEIAIKSTGINERTLASQGLLSCCLRAKG